MRSAPTNHYVDFFQQLAVREHERTNKPPPFTAEEHAKNREQLCSVKFVKPTYSHETKVNVSGICKKWARYCTDTKLGDWEKSIRNLSREITMDFFLFICGNYKVKSWGTTEEYLRQFQQLFTTITGQYMDRNDAKEVYKYHHTVLIPRFNLRAPNIDGKPVLNVDSLRVILTFNMAYDTGTLELERHRIQLAACYQILCYTGARPAELVHAERKAPKGGYAEKLFASKVVRATEEGDDSSEEWLEGSSQEVNDLLWQETKPRSRPKALCYEDITLMMVRHPDTNQAIPVMSIKFSHHKGADRKPKPTIFFFTPSKKLVFCAVSSMIALALHDDAFDASTFTDASSVLNTQVWGNRESIELRWKKSKLKCPVFRRIQRGILSDNEPMRYSKLRDDMRRQSLDSGFEKAWTPRFARRGAGNAANGDAPDTVRDQMMRHDPKFATFFSAYLNENAQFDLQNAFLEAEKEDKIFKMLAFVNLSRDPRATHDMVPDEVWANAPPDPTITKLEAERAALKQGYYRIEGHPEEEKIRQLTDEIRTKRAEREKSIVRAYREYYFYHKPTWDIEAQARGEIEEKFEEPVIEVAFHERARLAEIFCHQRQDLTDKEISCLRAEAIDLMVSLCDRRETPKSKPSRPIIGADTHIKQESLDLHQRSDAYADQFPLLLEPEQCPDCIGDDRLSVSARKFRYCRPNVRNDHFDDEHLPVREASARSGGPIRCYHPKCRETVFVHLDHFRRHVKDAHGISLRTSDNVKQRRLKVEKRHQMTRQRAKNRRHR